MQIFNVVGAGLRSLLYATINEIITDNVVELSDLQIDGESIDFIAATVSYGANMDTQQFPSYEIAQSIKTSASFQVSLVIPSVSSTMLTKALKIALQPSSVGGNQNFTFTFTIGGVEYSDTLKLVMLQHTTNAIEVPALTLHFER